MAHSLAIYYQIDSGGAEMSLSFVRLRAYGTFYLAIHEIWRAVIPEVLVTILFSILFGVTSSTCSGRPCASRMQALQGKSTGIEYTPFMLSLRLSGVGRTMW